MRRTQIDHFNFKQQNYNFIMNKNLLLVNGKESLLKGSMVIVKGSNRKANAYLAAKFVAEIVSGIGNEAFGHVESTGNILCFSEEIPLSWIGSACFDSPDGRLKMFPASLFKDGWTWESIKGQIELYKPDMVVIDSRISLDADEVARTAKENGCCIVIASCDASDIADEVFEVSVGDEMLLDVTRIKDGESLSFRMMANFIDDCVIDAAEKAASVSLKMAQLRNILSDNHKNAKKVADQNNAIDALDELMIAENHLNNVIGIINGNGMEEPTISDRYYIACSYLHEFLEIVSDELSLTLDTDDTEALSHLDAAQKMIRDAEAILERAYLYADGKQRGDCIRVVLNTFGEYFLPDWTSTERRVTGMPMPLEQK